MQFWYALKRKVYFLLMRLYDVLRLDIILQAKLYVEMVKEKIIAKYMRSNDKKRYLMIIGLHRFGAT